MNNQTMIFIGGMTIGALVGVIIGSRYVKKYIVENAVQQIHDKNEAENERRFEVFTDTVIDPIHKGANEFSESAPRIITPEEFGENEEYDTISLTLYSDGVLADDADKPINDVDEVIGKESLEHFGEYEDDSIFVRNDKLKCDYEVLIDERKYAQVLVDKPYLKEG